jgi:hypothetical protein
VNHNLETELNSSDWMAFSRQCNIACDVLTYVHETDLKVGHIAMSRFLPIVQGVGRIKIINDDDSIVIPRNSNFDDDSKTKWIAVDVRIYIVI